MSLDYMVKLRLQLGNQGFDTDHLSDDEVSERFELKLVRQCGFCRSRPNLVGDPDAPAVCRVCQGTDFVECERAVSKPSHLRRKSEAGWTECGLHLAKGVSVNRAPRVVEANCTCRDCKRQQAFNVERSARGDPNRRRQHGEGQLLLGIDLPMKSPREITKGNHQGSQRRMVMTEIQRTPQQMVSRDVRAEVEVYKMELKHLLESGRDGLTDFYDSVHDLADQIQRVADEVHRLLTEQSKSVREGLQKFREVQERVEDLLCDYSYEGPMAEVRDAILLEGLNLFEVAA